MNHCVKLGEILHPPEWEDTCTIIIWDYGSDGSLWVQLTAVINILTVSLALDISTNLQTTKGGVVPITVSI